MKKFFSLLRAIMSQDMQIFKFKAKVSSSDIKKIMIPIILAGLVMFSIGSMMLPIAIALKSANVMHVLLSISFAFPCILAFIEGIYKSPSVLFEARDNDMLFALPISKKNILLSRIIKLYVFQLLYSLLFSIPGVAIYAFFEKPTIYFYIITCIEFVLLPIIPSIIACFIGYIIKRLSSGLKARKKVELVFTFVLVTVLMIASLNSTGIIQSITENAEEIHNTINNVYYPIKAYCELINEFNMLTFLMLFVINIVPIALFLFIASKKYFSIISNSNNNIIQNKGLDNKKVLSFKPNKPLKALIKKEFNRYFSSNVYVINTLFGLVLLLMATVALCMNFDEAISYIANGNISEEDVVTLHTLAPKVFLAIVIAMSFMTSITSSSISIEGKTFNISKSLPVKTSKLLMSKVVMSDIITIPAVLICDIIFFFSFEVSVLDIALIMVASFLAPSIAATFGLIINLKFPKMDASSDSEVVKQSMSSMVSVFGGMFFAGVFVALTFILAGFGDIALIIEDVLLALILVGLSLIISDYGKKRYKEIEI